MTIQGIQKTYSNVAVVSPIIILPPAIPGLQVWSYFGTDPLGQAGNLVTGGPTLVVSGAGPSYQSNYAIFNPGSALGSLDTTIPRTSALLASGWSALWVAQNPSSLLPRAVMTDNFTGGFNCSMSADSTFVGNNPALVMVINGANPTSGTVVQTGPQTAMKCYALSWAGNGNPINAYDLTGGVSGATNPVTMVANANTVQIGDYTGGGSYCNPINIAQWMFASGALSLSALQAIQQSLATIMATRGITGI